MSAVVSWRARHTHANPYVDYGLKASKHGSVGADHDSAHYLEAVSQQGRQDAHLLHRHHHHLSSSRREPEIRTTAPFGVFSRLTHSLVPVSGRNGCVGARGVEPACQSPSAALAATNRRRRPPLCTIGLSELDSSNACPHGSRRDKEEEEEEEKEALPAGFILSLFRAYVSLSLIDCGWVLFGKRDARLLAAAIHPFDFSPQLLVW